MMMHRGKKKEEKKGETDPYNTPARFPVPGSLPGAIGFGSHSPAVTKKPGRDSKCSIVTLKPSVGWTQR